MRDCVVRDLLVEAAGGEQAGANSKLLNLIKRFRRYCLTHAISRTTLSLSRSSTSVGVVVEEPREAGVEERVVAQSHGSMET